MAKDLVAPVNAGPKLVAQTGFQKFCANFIKNWQLHVMILLPFAYLVIFHYFPMYGLQIGFRKYTATRSRMQQTGRKTVLQVE